MAYTETTQAVRRVAAMMNDCKSSQQVKVMYRSLPLFKSECYPPPHWGAILNYWDVRKVLISSSHATQNL